MKIQITATQNSLFAKHEKAFKFGHLNVSGFFKLVNPIEREQMSITQVPPVTTISSP